MYMVQKSLHLGHSLFPVFPELLPFFYPLYLLISHFHLQNHYFLIMFLRQGVVVFLKDSKGYLLKFVFEHPKPYSSCCLV